MSTQVGVELFVYGSLKRGFRHHDQLRDAEFLGPAETAPGHHLVLQGEYPALVRGGQGTVRGELYHACATLLATLDEFEGSAYERQSVELSAGGVAQAYFARGSTRELAPLPSGDWDRR
jgi:gamma-glutamylaminecyclotransferase